MAYQAMSDLTNVSTLSLSDNDALTYIASSQQWEPAAISESSSLQYLEIWDNGTTNGKAQSTYPLFQASDGSAGHILHNGLDSSEWSRLGTLAAGSVGGNWTSQWLSLIHI